MGSATLSLCSTMPACRQQDLWVYWVIVPLQYVTANKAICIYPKHITFCKAAKRCKPSFLGLSEVKCYAKRHVQGSLCTAIGLHPAFSEMSFVLKSHEETYRPASLSFIVLVVHWRVFHRIGLCCFSFSSSLSFRTFAMSCRGKCRSVSG